MDPYSYICSAQLISFEINWFYGLQIYEYGAYQLLTYNLGQKFVERYTKSYIFEIYCRILYEIVSPPAPPIYCWFVGFVLHEQQRYINFTMQHQHWMGGGEPTDIAQKIAYCSTIFGQDCSYATSLFTGQIIWVFKCQLYLFQRQTIQKQLFFITIIIITNNNYTN